MMRPDEVTNNRATTVIFSRFGKAWMIRFHQTTMICKTSNRTIWGKDGELKARKIRKCFIVPFSLIQDNLTLHSTVLVIEAKELTDEAIGGQKSFKSTVWFKERREKQIKIKKLLKSVVLLLFSKLLFHLSDKRRQVADVLHKMLNYESNTDKIVYKRHNDRHDEFESKIEKQKQEKRIRACITCHG
jgi:hypothetical protein